MFDLMSDLSEHSSFVHLGRLTIYMPEMAQI